MNEVMTAIRRGWDVFVRALFPLLLGGVLWTMANVLLQWLLLGPALFGLCLVALKTLRGRPADPADLIAALNTDPGTVLVAGWLFLVPFALWNALFSLATSVAEASVHVAIPTVPGVPLVLTLALLGHFGFGVFVFPLLADRRCGLGEALRQCVELADRPAASGSRVSGLTRQLLFTSTILVVVYELTQVRLLSSGDAGVHGFRFGLGELSRVLGLDFGIPVFLVLGGPLLVCLVTAWYWGRVHGQDAPPAREAEPGTEG